MTKSTRECLEKNGLIEKWLRKKVRAGLQSAQAGARGDRVPAYENKKEDVSTWNALGFGPLGQVPAGTESQLTNKKEDVFNMERSGLRSAQAGAREDRVPAYEVLEKMY